MRIADSEAVLCRLSEREVEVSLAGPRAVKWRSLPPAARGEAETEPLPPPPPLQPQPPREGGAFKRDENGQWEQRDGGGERAVAVPAVAGAAVEAEPWW